MFNTLKKKIFPKRKLEEFLKTNCKYAIISSYGIKELIELLKKDKEMLTAKFKQPQYKVFALFGIIDIHNQEDMAIMIECLNSGIEVNLNKVVFKKN